MGPYWAHMGPYGAHMGPYTRKFPKIPRKFHGFPWISSVEPLGAMFGAPLGLVGRLAKCQPSDLGSLQTKSVGIAARVAPRVAPRVA